MSDRGSLSDVAADDDMGRIEADVVRPRTGGDQFSAVSDIIGA
jgi:hypothetical protein